MNTPLYNREFCLIVGLLQLKLQHVHSKPQ